MSILDNVHVYRLYVFIIITDYGTTISSAAAAAARSPLSVFTIDKQTFKYNTLKWSSNTLYVTWASPVDCTCGASCLNSSSSLGVALEIETKKNRLK